MRDVGDAGEELLELVIGRGDVFIEGGDLIGDGADGGLQFGGVGAGAFERADLLGFGVLVGFELLGLRDGGAAFAVEVAEAVERKGAAAGGEAFGDLIEMGTEESEIEHLWLW